MKHPARLFAALLVYVITVCSLTVGASAGAMPWQYASERWQGTPLVEVKDRRDVTYLTLKEPGTAYYDFELTENDRAFYIFVLAGNYQGRGETRITLECFGKDNVTVKSYGTVIVSDDGSFHSAVIGRAPEKMFVPIPEGTEFIRLSISYDEGIHSPYFHVTAEFAEIAATDLSASEWSLSDKLSAVEVETTAFGYWISVAFVFVFALMLFGVRKYREKFKTGKLTGHKK